MPSWQADLSDAAWCAPTLSHRAQASSHCRARSHLMSNAWLKTFEGGTIGRRDPFWCNRHETIVWGLPRTWSLRSLKLAPNDKQPVSSFSHPLMALNKLIFTVIVRSDNHGWRTLSRSSSWSSSSSSSSSPSRPTWWVLLEPNLNLGATFLAQLNQGLL